MLLDLDLDFASWADGAWCAEVDELLEREGVEVAARDAGLDVDGVAGTERDEFEVDEGVDGSGGTFDEGEPPMKAENSDLAPPPPAETVALLTFLTLALPAVVVGGAGGWARWGVGVPGASDFLLRRLTALEPVSSSLRLHALLSLGAAIVVGCGTRTGAGGTGGGGSDLPHFHLVLPVAPGDPPVGSGGGGSFAGEAAPPTVLDSSRAENEVARFLVFLGSPIGAASCNVLVAGFGVSSLP